MYFMCVFKNIFVPAWYLVGRPFLSEGSSLFSVQKIILFLPFYHLFFFPFGLPIKWDISWEWD